MSKEIIYVELHEILKEAEVINFEILHVHYRLPGGSQSMKSIKYFILV
jgi:hypothetical protein